MAIFAGDLKRDRESAEANAERMRADGLKPWYAAMNMGREVHNTIEFSSSASQRLRFVEDRVETLNVIGAVAEVGVNVDVLEELIKAHVAARAASVPTVTEGVPE